MAGLRARRLKSERPAGAPALGARLVEHVTLQAHATGKIEARFHGHAVGLGTFSATTADRARQLRNGLPLAAFESGRRDTDKELDILVHRLARHGLVEYPLKRALSRTGADLAVIEPQVADYWPRALRLRDAESLVLSRFAYLRRRGDEMVLESPRAGALFRICDPALAALIAKLSTPQQIGRLRRQDGFSGIALLGLLVDCQILFKVAAGAGSGSRAAEGEPNLVLWDFHDLLFHTRSTEGRQANPLGGIYAYASVMPPLPAVRPRWPGKKIDLRMLPSSPSPLAKLLRQRHSTRSFDDHNPITLAELAQFLDGTARVLSRWKSKADFGDGGPAVGYATRPYPSAGASYELELYLAVDICVGLARGFYHYDSGGHALAPIAVGTPEFETLLTGAALAMGSPAAPQVLITIAARFGRMSWKYSALAYALILKDAGALMQTFYLMATDMELGGCAIGIANIDLFAKMTGIEFHIEGPVGQFALGRPAKPPDPDR